MPGKGADIHLKIMIRGGYAATTDYGPPTSYGLDRQPALRAAGSAGAAPESVGGTW